MILEEGHKRKREWFPTVMGTIAGIAVGFGLALAMMTHVGLC